MDPRFAKIFLRPDFLPRLASGDPLAWGCTLLAGASALAALFKKK